MLCLLIYSMHTPCWLWMCYFLKLCLIFVSNWFGKLCWANIIGCSYILVFPVIMSLGAVYITIYNFLTGRLEAMLLEAKGCFEEAENAYLSLLEDNPLDQVSFHESCWLSTLSLFVFNNFCLIFFYKINIIFPPYFDGIIVVILSWFYGDLQLIMSCYLKQSNLTVLFSLGHPQKKGGHRQGSRWYSESHWMAWQIPGNVSLTWQTQMDRWSFGKTVVLSNNFNKWRLFFFWRRKYVFGIKYFMFCFSFH